MNLPGYVALAHASRGAGIENVHYGAIAIVDRSGRLQAAAGSADIVVFPRSSLKPLQALALVAHPGFERLGLSEAELAVICGSHSGEPRHVQAVLEILSKAGATKEALRCGIHPPFYLEALGEPPTPTDVFTVLQNNCSGKHAGMLALAALLGAGVEGYAEPSHAVQGAIRAAISRYVGIAEQELAIGVDGCGVPNYALPLRALAHAYARLPAEADEADFGAAPRTIAGAMVRHPVMVAGLKRLDLALMHVGRGDWIAKSGAAGVRALAIRSRGLGIAIKIADGNARVRDLVTLEVLKQMGLWQPHADSPLALFHDASVRNLLGAEVGSIGTDFDLRRV